VQASVFYRRAQQAAARCDNRGLAENAGAISELLTRLTLFNLRFPDAYLAAALPSIEGSLELASSLRLQNCPDTQTERDGEQLTTGSSPTAATYTPPNGPLTDAALEAFGREVDAAGRCDLPG